MGFFSVLNFISKRINGPVHYVNVLMGPSADSVTVHEGHNSLRTLVCCDLGHRSKLSCC